jgi:hypothetical protein
MASTASHLLLLVVVVLAPLPFGSVAGYWLPVWCMILAVSLSLVDFRALSARHVRLVVPALATLALFLVLVAYQATGVPWTKALVSEAAGILGMTASPPIPSAAASTPWLSLGAPLAAALSFLASYFLCTDAQRADQLLRAVGLSGAAYAAYGILAVLFDPTGLLWTEKRAYLGNLTGTFVNRNTAATYFGSCSLVWLALLASEIGAGSNAGARSASSVRRLLGVPPWLFVSAAGLSLCTVAVLLTASRAGIILTVAMLLVLAGLALRRTFSRSARSVVSAAVLLLLAPLVLELLGGLVAVRIAYGGLFDESRWLVYEGSLAVVARHPWLGTGLGTFAEVFPSYRPVELGSHLYWDRAHSSVLESAVELGLPFMAVVAALWGYFLYQLARGIVSRRRGTRFPLAGFGVLLLGTLHSIVDFSLQIPGYAIVFAAVIGCGLAQSQSSRALGSASLPAKASGRRVATAAQGQAVRQS